MTVKVSVKAEQASLSVTIEGDDDQQVEMIVQAVTQCVSSCGPCLKTITVEKG